MKLSIAVLAVPFSGLLLEAAHDVITTVRRDGLSARVVLRLAAKGALIATAGLVCVAWYLGMLLGSVYLLGEMAFIGVLLFSLATILLIGGFGSKIEDWLDRYRGR